MVYVVSRIVEFIELGNGDLEHRTRMLHSLIQRDKQRSLLDYHTTAGALAATGNTATAAEPAAEEDDLRGMRRVLAANGVATTSPQIGGARGRCTEKWREHDAREQGSLGLQSNLDDLGAEAVVDLGVKLEALRGRLDTRLAALEGALRGGGCLTGHQCRREGTATTSSTTMAASARPPGDDADGSLAANCHHLHRCHQRFHAGTSIASATRPSSDDADGSFADDGQHLLRCQQCLWAGTAMASGSRPSGDDADGLLAAKSHHLQRYHQCLRERPAWGQQDKATGGDMNLLVYGARFGMVVGTLVMIFVLELLPTACHVRGAASKMAVGLKSAPFGFGLVIAAGTSTALGAGAVSQGRIVKIASKPVLAVGLGFSGGIMLSCCFIEFFVKAQLAFAADRSEGDAYLCATLASCAGVAVLRLITAPVHTINRNHVHDLACF